MAIAGGTIHWTNTTANMLYNFSYVNWGCARPERLSSFYGGNPGNFRARATQPDFQAEFPDFDSQTGMSLGQVGGIEDCVRLCAFMGAGGFEYLDGHNYCAFATPAWIDQAGVIHRTADPADGSNPNPWLLQTGNCNDENLHVYSLHALETAVPTALPTTAPTAAPVTPAPTGPPTSSAPTPSPSPSPTEAPTASPTASPTGTPSISPSISPTTSPTSSPTATPTSHPPSLCESSFESPVHQTGPCRRSRRDVGEGSERTPISFHQPTLLPVSASRPGVVLP